MKDQADYSLYECPYAHIEKECGHELLGPEGYENTYGVWCACGFRGPVFCLEPEDLKLHKKPGYEPGKGDRTMSDYNNSIDVEFNGLTFVVDYSYTPARPAPFAQTPDSPGYDDEGDAEEVEYEAKYPIIECAETFMEWLNLEENDEFRAMMIERMRDES